MTPITSPSLSLAGKQWKRRPIATGAFPTSKLHPFVAASLAAQGYNESNYQLALAPNYARDRHNPFLLRDMSKAVARIQQAITQKESILLISDFDVDGVTASLISNAGLQSAGVLANRIVREK